MFSRRLETFHQWVVIHEEGDFHAEPEISYLATKNAVGQAERRSFCVDFSALYIDTDCQNHVKKY